MAFVPLVNRSAFTFYSGTMTPAALAEACAAKGYRHAAVCDRGGLYAAVRFAKAAESAGVTPVFGAEITDPGCRAPSARNGERERRETATPHSPPHRFPVSPSPRLSSPSSFPELSPSPPPSCSSPLAPDSLFLSSSSSSPSSPSSLRASASLRCSPLFAFARDLEGYARLNALITKRTLAPARFDRIREAAAATEGGHLALVASGREFLYGLQKSGAEKGSLFARLTGDARADRDTRAVAQWLGIPLVAAPAASFLSPSGYAVHRVLRAAKHKKPEAQASDYLLPPREAAARFPRDQRALDTAGDLAASCAVKLPLGDWLLPHPPMPPGETEAGRLTALAYAGLAKRVSNVTVDYLDRMEHELKIIIRLGFAGYFLVVEDIARFARDQGIPNIGRGSGAGSLVSYCLWLTHVDPVAEALYFERFLNPERRNPPDIDLDFSWRERDHVIQHVYDTYGGDNVCMIATHNTFSARSAFRDVAKAFSVPEEEINIVARAVPRASFGALEQAMAKRPESRRVNVKESPWKDILEVAEWIDGFPRHLSVHCGGVLVSPVPLTRRLSLERAAKGVAITQCDMYDVEDLGLVKIDLLGNRSLGVLVDAVDAVERNTGTPPPVFPPERLYGNDKTNDLISGGNSMGCFYIESPGMRLLLRRLNTRTFQDLTCVSSIIRPGVSESGMMEAYVKRRLGEAPPEYAHPGLEPILQETFGVMVYQEDVIRVAHEFIGLTLGEADLLRRAMSGKYRSKTEMDALTNAFFERGREKGIAPDVLDELWRQIRSFAGYAFCKAHSASFAQLSYQVAYLKSHHPAEFFAALVNNQGGFYGTAAYVEEARRFGLRILPPDVNASGDDFAGKDDMLRCGFFTLRGLRPGALDRLYEERGEGPFRSLGDLVARLRHRLLPSEVEILIRAGALDSFGRHRGFLLRLLETHGMDGKAIRNAEQLFHVNSVTTGTESPFSLPSSVSPSPRLSVSPQPPSFLRRQESRLRSAILSASPLPQFSDSPSLRIARLGLPSAAEAPPAYDRITFVPPRHYLPVRRKAEDWHRESRLSSDPGRPLSLAEVLSGERRTLGLCVTAHPLTPMIDWAGGKGYTHAEDLASMAGRRARVWGQVITYKHIPTRKTKDMMGFATLEDPSGLSELVFFPKAYNRFGDLITRGRPLVAEGVVENDRGGLTLTVDRCWAVRGIVVPRAVQEFDEPFTDVACGVA